MMYCSLKCKRQVCVCVCGGGGGGVDGAWLAVHVLLEFYLSLEIVIP